MKRSDIFITTKILSAANGVDKNYEKALDSVEKIDGKDGYVDLFLIHSPSMGAKSRKEVYQALEKLLEAGKTKSIGVSNWGIGHIEELKSFAKVYPPHVNQIEVRSSCPVDVHQLTFPVAPIFTATRGCRLLPQERDHHRSILPLNSKSKSE